MKLVWKYILGVCIALVGHSVSALGITLQKYAHNQNTDKLLIKRPAWIFGLLCLGLCEVINFIALAFAPVSVIAPLGSFSVVMTAIYSKFILHEKNKKSSIIAILLIVVGSVLIVVFGPKASNQMTTDQFIKTISSTNTIIYISCNLGLLLVLLLFGNNSFTGTLGAAAVSAGNTVTLAKLLSMFVAVSISSINQLTNYLPYLVLILIISSIVLQMYKLNKAMKRYPSYICCAIQYVILSIITIGNSTVLFGEVLSLQTKNLSIFCSAIICAMVGVFWLSKNSEPEEIPEDVIKVEYQDEINVSKEFEDSAL